MKYLFAILLSGLFGFSGFVSRPQKVQESKGSFYDFKLKSIDGDEIDFSQYEGKKVLLVNVASECGYTPQYKELQQLHQIHGDKVVVLGFPANNFGAQEPGTNAQIKEFCKKEYAVTFPMFEKISVVGNDQHPLYNWLSDKAQNGWNEEAPNWNFCKYLVDENGKLLKFYKSAINPMGDEVLTAIGAK